MQLQGRLQPHRAFGLQHRRLIRAAEGRGTEAGAQQGPNGEAPAPDAQAEGQGPPGGQIVDFLVDIHPEPQANHEDQLGGNDQPKAQGALVGE